jgi:peptide/nickel transport system permease protein
MTLADVELGLVLGPPDPHPISDRDETSNRARQTARALLRRPGFLVAVTYVVLVVLSGIVPRLFAPGDPTRTVPAEKLQAPSASHLFGTDELGRDLFTRMVHGSALSIEATAISVGLAVVVGLAIGVVSGYAGGWVDSLLMRFVDVLLAIPALLLALAIVTALGFGTINVAIAVGVGLTPGFARITRAEVLRVKTLPYVEAARSSGAGRLRILSRHVLPNSWGPVAVLAVLDFGTAILAVSSLSFLGFGAPPPQAEWGSLVAAGRTYLVTSPWLTLLPGLAVGAAVYALNHIAKTFEELQRWH